ncbi:MAG: alpha/beta fold hydrolase [Patescibacteria group bacterium]
MSYARTKKTKRLSLRLLPARLVSLETPKRYLLPGIYFGPRRPKTVYIFLHGLGGNLFSRHELALSLVSRDTGALLFNNRGSGVMGGVRRMLKSGRPTKYRDAGMAHEVFTECADDIDGAVDYARNLGAKNIFLVGHSTGCQKAVYYLAKRPRSRVKGAVLLAPMSDYSTVHQDASPAVYRRALARARQMVKAGKKHELLPLSVWPKLIDAQRFISLYTPESAEEIFGYASGRKPVLLNKIKKPLLAILAEADEFGDRPAKEIAAWFRAALARQRADTIIIKGVGHGFSPRHLAVRAAIRKWRGKFNV